ncbi:hypothetical protein [Nonomuraea sp. NPDC048826]|uniref:hypothetical protein n=1 Tax=Nonomuraea sp. NPDC048826 TaxID=3364347 RepID=UPI0037136825
MDELIELMDRPDTMFHEKNRAGIITLATSLCDEIQEQKQHDPPNRIALDQCLTDLKEEIGTLELMVRHVDPGTSEGIKAIRNYWRTFNEVLQQIKTLMPGLSDEKASGGGACTSPPPRLSIHVTVDDSERAVSRG